MDTTASQTFTIRVTRVNDAPNATFSTGPADESGQSITIVTFVNDNNARCTDQLTSTPAAN